MEQGADHNGTDVSTAPSGMLFSRSAWLNRLQTGVEQLISAMHAKGMAPTAGCECGAKEQTANYMITSCPIYHRPNETRALSAVNKSLVLWLTDTCPVI